MNDLKTATIRKLHEHGRAVGFNDVFYALSDLPDVSDDELADEISDGAYDAYGDQRPNLQKTWAAFHFEALEGATFEEDSPVDELLCSIFRTAYELGFLAGAEKRPQSEPDPHAEAAE